MTAGGFVTGVDRTVHAFAQQPRVVFIAHSIHFSPRLLKLQGLIGPLEQVAYLGTGPSLRQSADLDLGSPEQTIPS